MKSKTFAMLLAAALMAGSIPAVWAEDEAPTPDEQEYAQEMEEYGRGPRGNWRRGGPGRDDWHRRGRFDGDRDDWRGPRYGYGRGPGGPGGYHGFDRRDFDRGPGFHRGGYGPGFQHRGFGRGPGFCGDDFQGFGFRGWERLDLDANQKARMIDVMTANFRARLEAKMAIQEARSKLWDLQKDENAGADAIVAAHAALGEAEGRMQVMARKGWEDMKNVFTPEQLQKLEDTRKGPPPPRPGDRRPGGKPMPGGKR